MLRQFLKNEIMRLTFSGAVQRSNTYSTTQETAAKKRFRAALKSLLQQHADKYRRPQTCETYLRDVKKIADTLSSPERFPDTLVNNRFRLGIAQKALGLYLKYLWAIGEVKEPPLCPFDRVVVDELRKGTNGGPYLNVYLNWTELDTMDDLCRLKQAAEAAAHHMNMTVGQWELQLWNNRPQA